MTPQMEVPLAASPEERAVMAVLTERGHYVEDFDSFQWANVDAVHVMEWLNERGRTFRVAWDALVDTGLHDPTDDSECRCLGADVEAIREALGRVSQHKETR